MIFEGEEAAKLARLIRAAHLIDGHLHRKPDHVIYVGGLDEAEELASALQDIDPKVALANSIEDEIKVR